MPRAVTAQTKKLYMREGKKVEDWGTISIDDAVIEKGRVFRCIECHAQVRPHRKSRDQEAHFEHLREFEGCSLSQAWNGIKRPNASALK